MSETETVEQLARRAPVVVFHSPLTDLDALPTLLERGECDGEVVFVELGMGSQGNRLLFRELRAWTGHPTLPQVFIEGAFAGGLQSARAALMDRYGAPEARSARWLGYLGLLPFAVGAGLCWVDGGFGARWLLAYAAVILSFVGAVHWGASLAGAHRHPLAFVASVLPALTGWLALLLPPVVGLGVCVVAFAGWRAWERFGRDASVMPRWYERLRDHLTAGAMVGLLVGLAGSVVSLVGMP